MPEQRQSPLILHLEMFLLHQESSHHTRRTVEFYRYNLGQFISHLADEGVGSADQITAHHIRGYLVSLERKDLSAAYVHSYARAIKTWLNFLAGEEIIVRSPMAKVKMPKLEEKILPPFSESDIRALLAATSGETKLRDRAIILTLLDTGLRAAEFLTLTVGAVDKEGVILITGKGRKQRWVRVSARTRQALLRWLSTRRGVLPDDPLWIGRRGPLTIDGLYQATRRLGRRAGVSPVGLHRFRRTFAIAAYRNGMNVLELKEILGHADLSTTRQYLKFEKDDMIRAHQAASPVDNWKL